MKNKTWAEVCTFNLPCCNLCTNKPNYPKGCCIKTKQFVIDENKTMILTYTKKDHPEISKIKQHNKQLERG